MMHSSGDAGLGFFVWGIDLAIRFLYMALWAHPHAALLEMLPGDVVQVTIPRNAHFHHRAGEYVFLCVPELSLFEWHPFSISSAPHEGAPTAGGGSAEKTGSFTLHVRALGDWTKRFQALAAKTAGKPVTILFEGPYGRPMVRTKAFMSKSR
jgi:predicted ferric reductase